MKPTPHPHVFTTQLTGPDLSALLARTGATPAVADPALAKQLGPLPQLPPGLPIMDRVRVEAAKAGVPATAVLMVTVALLDEAVTTSGMLPPPLAAVQLPPTVIVGSPAQTAAVLSAAEALAASRRGRVS